MKTRVSKAYRNDQHIGFKKTVAGRSWFLIYCTTPSDEARRSASPRRWRHGGGC